MTDQNEYSFNTALEFLDALEAAKERSDKEMKRRVPNAWKIAKMIDELIDSYKQVFRFPAMTTTTTEESSKSHHCGGSVIDVSDEQQPSSPLTEQQKRQLDMDFIDDGSDASPHSSYYNEDEDEEEEDEDESPFGDSQAEEGEEEEHSLNEEEQMIEQNAVDLTGANKKRTIISLENENSEESDEDLIPLNGFNSGGCSKRSRLSKKK